MKRLRTGIIALAVLCAAFFYGCRDKDSVIPEELVNGYWMENVAPEGMLLSFEPGGLVYNYIYSFSDADNIYYAYPDPEWAAKCEYLMDAENNRLFIGPDRWFDIIRLTAGEMTLEEADDGKQKLGFVKLKAGEVELVSAARFRELFPER